METAREYDPFSASMSGFAVDAKLQERLAFLKRCYIHVFGAIFLLAAIEYVFFTTPIAPAILNLFGSMWWLGLIGVMGACWFARRLAFSGASQTTQYGGLLIYVVAEAVFLVPALARALFLEPNLIGKAAFLTVAITGSLTLVVVLSKKDFSFLRNILWVAGLALFAIGVCSMLFGGFSLGILFSGAVVLLMCGYILYETSMIMNHLPTTAHVAGALMLFGSITELFRHLLYLSSYLSDD